MRAAFLTLILSLLFIQSADAACKGHSRLVKATKSKISHDTSSTTYEHLWDSDCTDEMVQFTTTATVRTTEFNFRGAKRSRYTITLSSDGTGVTTGIRYTGTERAVIRTIEADGTVDQTITIDLQYIAEGPALDLVSHQMVRLFTDANGQMTVVAEESETQCTNARIRKPKTFWGWGNW